MAFRSNAEFLGTLKGNETVAWFGEEKNIFEHVSAMIGNEQMHIGQIIAFMYAEEIEIPLSIKNEMGLSE